MFSLWLVVAKPAGHRREAWWGQAARAPLPTAPRRWNPGLETTRLIIDRISPADESVDRQAHRPFLFLDRSEKDSHDCVAGFQTTLREGWARSLSNEVRSEHLLWRLCHLCILLPHCSSGCLKDCDLYGPRHSVTFIFFVHGTFWPPSEFPRPRELSCLQRVRNPLQSSSELFFSDGR